LRERWPPQAASPGDSLTATATLTQTPAATCDEPARAESNLVVKGTHFGVKCLVVPAGEPLAVRLENRDSNFNHNFSIYTPEFSVAFTGDIAFPDETLRYDVPALEAGDYLFQCDLHPREMSGPLIAR
jgi:plastocyanin